MVLFVKTKYFILFILDFEFYKLEYLVFENIDFLSAIFNIS